LICVRVILLYSLHSRDRYPYFRTANKHLHMANTNTVPLHRNDPRACPRLRRYQRAGRREACGRRRRPQTTSRTLHQWWRRQTRYLFVLERWTKTAR
jgi:hypothetical protein